MKLSHSFLFQSACLAFALTAFSGCGSDPAAGLGDPVSVTGVVKMDGAPVANVEVTFTRLDGGAPPEFRNISVMTGASGEYTMDTVYPAEYQVMIYDRSGEENEEEMQAMDVGPYEKYGMESELRANVAEGSVQHDFDLVSK